MIVTRNVCLWFHHVEALGKWCSRGRAPTDVRMGWWFPVRCCCPSSCLSVSLHQKQWGYLYAIRSARQEDVLFLSARLVPARVRLAWCGTCGPCRFGHDYALAHLWAAHLIG